MVNSSMLYINLIKIIKLDLLSNNDMRFPVSFYFPANETDNKLIYLETTPKKGINKSYFIMVGGVPDDA